MCSKLRYMHMNSKGREEVLDLYKHISDSFVERKVDRLMLSKEIWYMKKGIW